MVGKNLNSHHKSFIIFIAVLIPVLVGAIICSTIYLITREDSSKNLNNEEIVIIPRRNWTASERRGVLGDLNLPIDLYIIAHTVTSECKTIQECSKIVRSIQNYHMESRNLFFDDIGYNFLIGGDGQVYEGRGWKYQGAHCSGYNQFSIGVAFIGNFQDKLPNENQINAGLALFEEGVKIGAVKPNYKIFGAKQLRNTQSPGDKFFREVMSKWKHFEKVEN